MEKLKKLGWRFLRVYAALVTLVAGNFVLALGLYRLEESCGPLVATLVLLGLVSLFLVWVTHYLERG